jgi:hypothetical protein
MRFLCGVAVLLVVVDEGLSEVPYEEVRRVIGECTDLDSVRQRELYQALQAGFVGAHFGKDKQEHLAEHLVTMLSESVVGNEKSSPEEWAVVLETVKWRAQNYAALAEIDERRRVQGRQALGAAGRVVRDFIAREYESIPATIRDQIAERAQAEMLEREARVGNYFYPQTVYALDAEKAEAAVSDALNADLNLRTAVQDYQGLDGILADDAISEASKAAHVRMFLARWGSCYAGVAERVVPEIFNAREALANHVPMPHTLVEAREMLNEKKRAAMKQRIAKRRRRRKLAIQNNRLLLGTGISVVDGQVIMEDDVVNDLRTEAWESPQTATTLEPTSSSRVATRTPMVNAGKVDDDSATGGGDLRLLWAIAPAVAVLCVAGVFAGLVRRRLQRRTKVAQSRSKREAGDAA